MQKSNRELKHWRYVISTGLAMFSMFFGAGNIVFPLMVGQEMGTLVGPATLGLLLTAVGVPFMGLLGMIYYNGDYRAFFSRIGTAPAYLITLFIMILIGPVNAIPRCIALSYGTINLYVPSMSIFWFSIVSCLLIFAATSRKNRIVDLLGDLLSPLLILALLTIVVKGFIGHPEAMTVVGSQYESFMYGLIKGYNTMDLLGTFFFSSIIIASLRMHFPEEKSVHKMAGYALQASYIGAGLLMLDYVAFAYLASYYGSHISNLTPEILLGTLANLILGGAGGVVVSAAVALACLTTAITLVAVFAEYLKSEVLNNRVSYSNSLIITLLTSAAFANLGFSHIIAMIEPILIVGYPALITLTICNILYKKWNFTPVKIPVALTVLASLLNYLS